METVTLWKCPDEPFKESFYYTDKGCRDCHLVPDECGAEKMTFALVPEGWIPVDGEKIDMLQKVLDCVESGSVCVACDARYACDVYHGDVSLRTYLTGEEDGG